MVDIEELQKKVIDFRDERGWNKYHNPKDLGLSISIESAELLELFQWREDCLESVDRERLGEEMADIMIYLLLLADNTEIDLAEAVEKKLNKNERKYPPDEEHFS